MNTASANIQFNHVVYKMMKSFVSHLPNDLGLRIFGGYVRDMIRKSHANAAYYNEGHHYMNFSDPTYDTETIDRLLCPTDLDIFVHTYASQAIENALIETARVADLKIKGRNNTEIGVLTSTGFASYFGQSVRGVYIKHYKVYLPYTDHSFNIDLIYTQDHNLEPPFSRLDFQENGLYYCADTKTYRVSNYLRSRLIGRHADTTSDVIVLARMVENIKNKVLTPAYVDAHTRQEYLDRSFYAYRLRKFERRGWTVRFPEIPSHEHDESDDK